MTPKHTKKRRKNRFLKRALRASLIAAVMLAIGFYFELHLMLKLAELVGAALAEAILFPEV